MCCAFKVPRSTFVNNLDGIGWKDAGVGQDAAEAKPQTAVKMVRAKVKWRQLPSGALFSIGRG